MAVAVRQGSLRWPPLRLGRWLRRDRSTVGDDRPAAIGPAVAVLVGTVRKTTAEPGQQPAQHAAQGDHDPAGADRADAGVGRVDAADEAGGLGTGAGGAGLGQVLLGPLQQHGPVLRLGHLVRVAGTHCRPSRASRSLVLASWSSSSTRRSAITRSSTSTPRRARANSLCRWRPISSSDSLAAWTLGWSADIVPSSVAVRSWASIRPSFSRRSEGCDSSRRFGVATSRPGIVLGLRPRRRAIPGWPFRPRRSRGVGADLLAAATQGAVAGGHVLHRTQLGQVAAHAILGRRQRGGRLVQVGLRQADGLAQLVDHALGLGVAELLELGLQLLEDGLVQGHRSGAVFRPHGEIEHFGLAELGPLGRNELDVLAERRRCRGRWARPRGSRSRPAGRPRRRAASKTLRPLTTSRIVSWTVFISSG